MMEGTWEGEVMVVEAPVVVFEGFLVLLEILMISMPLMVVGGGRVGRFLWRVDVDRDVDGVGGLVVFCISVTVSGVVGSSVKATIS